MPAFVFELGIRLKILIVQEIIPYKERKIFKNKLLEIWSDLLIELKPNSETNIE